jgi:hypothetical protein
MDVGTVLRGHAGEVRGPGRWHAYECQISVCKEFASFAPAIEPSLGCQTTESYQVSIENLTDVKGYATLDLFMKHPTRNLFLVASRRFDLFA